MKLSLDLRATLSQTLTPQQIQYLKLLQLPVVQLEQQVLQEIEQNPMLELATDPDDTLDSFDSFENEAPINEYTPPSLTENAELSEETPHEETTQRIPDYEDPFEFHKLIWQDDSEYEIKHSGHQSDDEDVEPFQIKDNVSFADELSQQLRMLDLTNEELLLGENIIGNIDEDGYLRRDLEEIVDDTNSDIVQVNFEIQRREKFNRSQNGGNPAKQFALSDESTDLLSRVYSSNPDIAEKTNTSTIANNNHSNEIKKVQLLNNVSLHTAEKVLGIIQQLDPPGVGSRNIQECLTAQCKSILHPNRYQQLALDIITKTYDAFTKKHYHTILKELNISEDDLRNAIDVIRRLNPKPGGGEFNSEMNTVIPDFIIEKDYESGDLKIIINDSHIPPIKLNTAYEKLKKEVQYKNSNKETKEWIRNKYEDAKFLIQAIQQRRRTMLKIMTAIAHLQREFFDYGVIALKPLIYKDVSEHTGLDISTVCRIVNGKYVQTEFGTFELKFFFSESLPTEDGEEVASKVVKETIRTIIENESKKKPLSDDKIAQMLKEKGYMVARRTVAKYREQLKIPVARLRKEI